MQGSVTMSSVPGTNDVAVFVPAVGALFVISTDSRASMYSIMPPQPAGGVAALALVSTTLWRVAHAAA